MGEGGRGELTLTHRNTQVYHSTWIVVRCVKCALREWWRVKVVRR